MKYLYQSATFDYRAVEYNCMNLMFVGVHDIGKTTLLSQIRKNRDVPKGTLSPTVST